MTGTPTIDDQVKFYDRWNRRNRSGELEEVPFEIRTRGKRVLEYLSRTDRKNAKILEVGCGTGWLTKHLNELGKVTAIDLSPTAIEIARSRDSHAEYIAGDFFAFDFGTRVFDVVVCVETLFYVQDQQGFMEKLATLVPVDGLLAATTVNKYVYERSRDIGPPEAGQIRKWLSRRGTVRLIGRYFDVTHSFTIEPRGDLGFLRLVNSTKLNRVLELVFSPATLKTAKEKMGIGGGVVIIAKRNKRVPAISGSSQAST